MSDRQERRNAKLRDSKKLDEGIRREVIGALMSTRRGRRYIWLQLEACHIFASTFSTSHNASLIMSFKEGERNIGLQLYSDVVRFAPDKFVEMASESSGQEEEVEDERSADPDPADSGND